MKRLWPVVFPLVRPAVLTLAGVLVAQLVAVLVLWGVRHFLYPGWQQAEAAQQAAQGQLEEARAEQADVQNHLRQYQQMVAAGLVGGEPRAVWVEDLLRILQQQDLQGQVSFTLAAPEAVELPQAAVAQARVQRHDGVGLDGKRLAPQFQHALRQGLVKTFQHYLVISYTHYRSINELRKQKTCQS